GSRFGASRDGGRRAHHGVDIFAPRGTPVVAVSPGTVNRVGTNNLGGLIVWVRDDFGNRLYYAHLDSQSVTSGQRVEVGDTLGTVGNTGNARTTPPHLHFGVYRRGEGPVDPWWFIHQPRGTPPRLVADTTNLGEWVRVRANLAVLRDAPGARADSVRALDRHTTARVVAAIGEWYRVRLPDGTAGYLSARAMERAGTAIAAAEFTPADSVLTRPAHTGERTVVLEGTRAGGSIAVFGRFEGFLMVRTPNGVNGWLEGADGSL
ncbi:MAG: peptidoglycan DD-metalloendopeptidase family protein, partial [Gemmatimonadales bacterium]